MLCWETTFVTYYPPKILLHHITDYSSLLYQWNYPSKLSEVKEQALSVSMLSQSELRTYRI